MFLLSGNREGVSSDVRRPRLLRTDGYPIRRFAAIHPAYPEKQGQETQETPQARQLVRISEMPYHWYSQKSGLRLAAFAEPYPALPKGYGLRLR